MADSINTINVGGIDKEVEDTVARTSGTSANDRCTSLESGLSNLSTRVDEIIAPTGEAPSAAEVADARIGADNTVYNTLGNAIRGQINGLNGYVDFSTRKISGSYYKLRNSDNKLVLTADANTERSIFIPIKKGDRFYVEAAMGNQSGYTLRPYFILNSSKEVIEYPDERKVQGIITITNDNAAYIVFGSYKPTLGSDLVFYFLSQSVAQIINETSLSVFMLNGTLQIDSENRKISVSRAILCLPTKGRFFSIAVGEYNINETVNLDEAFLVMYNKSTGELDCFGSNAQFNSLSPKWLSICWIFTLRKAVYALPYDTIRVSISVDGEEIKPIDSEKMEKCTGFVGVDDIQTTSSNGTLSVDIAFRSAFAFIYSEFRYYRIDISKTHYEFECSEASSYVFIFNKSSKEFEFIQTTDATGIYRVYDSVIVFGVFCQIIDDIIIPTQFIWYNPLIHYSSGYSRAINALQNANKRLSFADAFLVEKNALDIQAIQSDKANRLSRIFMRVGCIGDSYTSGYIKLSADEPAVGSNPDYAWPRFMENLTGRTWTNFGISGSTSKGWMSGAARLDEVQAAGNKCQAYVIGLMLNDMSTANPYRTPCGVITDIGTDNDTYYAWYYKLVVAVAAVNPDAKIFCNTCPKEGTNFTLYNQAVRDIVAYCHDTLGMNVYLCDLADTTKYFNSKFYKNPVFEADAIQGHYTAIGYEFMAECYLRVLSDTISDSIHEFQNVFRIPFDANTN